MGNVSYDVGSPVYGSLKMKRKLTGKAYVDLDKKNFIFVQNWYGDNKTINMDPVSLYYDVRSNDPLSNTRVGVTYKFEFFDDRIVLTQISHVDGSTYPESYTWGTEKGLGDTFLRGDRAKENPDLWSVWTTIHVH